MDRSALLARELFEQGFNCAQATLCAFEDLTGLERQTALGLASSFGGGIGGTGEVCGALVGSLMALGSLRGCTQADPALKKRYSECVRRYLDRFRNQFGGILCRELLERNERDALVRGLPRPCMRYVVGAVEQLGAFLQEEDCVPAGR